MRFGHAVERPMAEDQKVAKARHKDHDSQSSLVLLGSDPTEGRGNEDESGEAAVSGRTTPPPAEPAPEDCCGQGNRPFCRIIRP